MSRYLAEGVEAVVQVHREELAAHARVQTLLHAADSLVCPRECLVVADVADGGSIARGGQLLARCLQPFQ